MTDTKAFSGNTYVGLDVHKDTIAMAICADDQIVLEKTIAHDHQTLAGHLSDLTGVRCCYEAGPTGFKLQRDLSELGFACEVIAPGLIPTRPGDRVKTDRRDARKLALLYANGLLTPVHIPDPCTESVRDLIRAREDARIDRTRDRQRLTSFMLRHGRPLPRGSWSLTRRRWLGGQRFEHQTAQQAFDTYLHAVDLVDSRIHELEQSIELVAQCEPFADLVAKLRCLRGVDTLTALAICAEVDDFSRFPNAASFMGFVGLVPSERSSGAAQRRGAITKVGNSHLRRLLVESAWHARRQPVVGAALARRQRGQDPLVIERAWRAQRRLHRLWTRMDGRGKPRQKTVVACARELSGFVWAIATDQPLNDREKT